ncbi:MAG: dTDP-4-dehydrorhamnose reductase [Methylophilaceae bacterium]
MTKILLIGRDGQVGWELQRALALLGELYAINSADCDLADTKKLRAIITGFKPDFIVNAAAYTAVDKAETDIELARAVNATVPGVMAEEALKLGAWLIHYSTDYVFDGTKEGLYLEGDVPNPLNVYGATKLEGELAIQQSGCRHLIFRTSWVFATRGNNFAKTMLRLAVERDVLKVVGDQQGAPTSAELIADVTALCLQRVLLQKSDVLDGVYHLTASGYTTWHAYAQYVLSYAVKVGISLRCQPEDVIAIPSSEYPVPAKRPMNSILDSTKLQKAFAITLPDWQYHAARMLEEVLDPQPKNINITDSESSR